MYMYTCTWNIKAQQSILSTKLHIVYTTCGGHCTCTFICSDIIIILSIIMEYVYMMQLNIYAILILVSNTL